MKKITISAEVYDDFKNGMCYFCPFSHLDDDDEWDIYDQCILGKSYDDCPIEVVEE